MEKPTMRERIDALGVFIWDKENNKVLGRGAKSWAEIGVFYLIYYACLASFFAATLAVFYETISDDEPKLQSDSSLLDGNPGLGFRPRVDLEEPKIKSVVGGSNKDYKDDLDKFLESYNKALDTTDCTGLDKTRKGEKKACKVDYTVLTKECNPGNNYGFSAGTPCVLIKMNKVFGWEPKLWSDAADAKFKLEWNMKYDPAVVPLRCYAKDSGDQDKVGIPNYYPQQGFPIHYYPYQKQKDYRSPVVFVQFGNTTHGETYEIECRIYAKNVEFDRTDMQGSVQFKLYIK